MAAMSKPIPGSRAAVLDSVVRAVAEGRYRMAQLHLLWHGERAPFDEMAELVNEATEIPAMPLDLTPEAVLAGTRNVLLPDWLARHLDNEVARIFAKQPVGGTTPVQLVARVAAAMLIDVSAESTEAAHRIDLGDPELSDEDVVADLTDEPVSAGHGNGRTRLIHLGGGTDTIGTDTIDLSEVDRSEVPARPQPFLPPPPL